MTLPDPKIRQEGPKFRRKAILESQYVVCFVADGDRPITCDEGWLKRRPAMKLQNFAALAALTLTLTLLPRAARADLNLSFEGTFSNSTTPAGSAPWLLALIEDIDATHVRLTLTNLLQSGSEFISFVNFNVTGDPADVSLVPPPTGTGAGAFENFLSGNDAYPADGGGKYDLELQFNKANSGDRFGSGDVLTLVLTRAAGLTPDDFAVIATPSGGNGPYYAAAHIQGIGTGAGSTWTNAQIVTPTPEPAGVLLVGTILGGIIFARRRR